MGISANWSLSIGGDHRKFDEWGFVGLRRRCVNLSHDFVQFTHPVRSAAADPVLPYGSAVKLYDPAGVQWFTGTVTHISRSASAGDEAMVFGITGPWYYAQKIMQVAWPHGNTALPLPLRVSTHLMLNLGDSGEHTSSRTVITNVLNHMIAAGAGFQLGQILPTEAEDLYPPISEVRDRTCGEILRDQLRWSPNSVGWFDYTTDPPTYHLRGPNNLTPILLPFKGSNTSAGTSLVPRYDLQFSEVLLKYEITQTVNGLEYIGWQLDRWPLDAAGTALDAYIQTIDLRGPTRSQTKVTILTRPIDPTDIAWWQEKLPILSDPSITDLSLEFLGRTAENYYPNELIEGSLADWMGFTSEPDTVQAKLRYKQDGTQRTDVLFEIPVAATTAQTGTYKSPLTIIQGDPVPLGLAKALHDHLSPLQWEGQHTLTEKECSGQVGLGNILNLSGGHADWLALNAIIQVSEEDIDLGQTTVSFGPRSHLGPTDVVEYLRGR